MHAEIIEVGAWTNLARRWQELLDDEAAPDRFELTEHGEIVLSPRPTNRHQTVVSIVATQLRAQLGDLVLHEVAVLAKGAGVRCPDLAWLPKELIAQSLSDGPLTAVPPLVVEVLSPGNRKPGIAQKIDGYLQGGAREVVVIGTDGKLAFYRADGAHTESILGVRLDLPPELFA